MRVQKRRFLCMFKSQVNLRLTVQIPLTDLRAIPGPGKMFAPDVQFRKMNMDALLNQPNINEVTLRGQNTPLKV